MSLLRTIATSLWAAGWQNGSQTGADVTVGWSGSEDRAAEANKAVETRGHPAVAVRLDLRDLALVGTGVAQAAEAWDRTIVINFHGLFLGYPPAAQNLRAAQGTIVNFGSTI